MIRPGRKPFQSIECLARQVATVERVLVDDARAALDDVEPPTVFAFSCRASGRRSAGILQVLCWSIAKSILSCLDVGDHAGADVKGRDLAFEFAPATAASTISWRRRVERRIASIAVSALSAALHVAVADDTF